MTRYVRQKDKFRCGPVAILNALRWAGLNINYKKSINNLTLMCFCKPGRGTSHNNFDNALRELCENFFKVRRVYHPTLKQIEEHLQNNGAVILNYRICRIKKEEQRHFQLVVGMDKNGKYFHSVNAFSNKPAFFKISREKFKSSCLRSQRVDKSFKAWFLTKKEK